MGRRSSNIFRWFVTAVVGPVKAMVHTCLLLRWGCLHISRPTPTLSSAIPNVTCDNASSFYDTNVSNPGPSQLSSPQRRSPAQWESLSQSPSPTEQPPGFESQHESPPHIQSFHKDELFIQYQHQYYLRIVTGPELGKPADLGRDDNVQGFSHRRDWAKMSHTNLKVT